MSLSPQPLRVLISGAGIAGPCLAYWLSRTRLSPPPQITIVERSPTPRITGQAVDVRGSAISIVNKMGLLDELKARNTTEIGTKMLNTKGNVIAEFDKGSGPTAEYEILRADLCGMFLDKTSSLPNIKYRFGDYVTRLDSSPSTTTNNTTTASFHSGHRESYDLIVAADGSTSKIRQSLLDESLQAGTLSAADLNTTYNFIGQYTAFFSIPRLPTDTPHWYWFNDLDGLALMIRPHRSPPAGEQETVGCYMCITTSAHGVEDREVEDALENGVSAQKELLKRRFSGVGWQAERILAGMLGSKDFYMSKAAQVKSPIWHKHRTVLIGDAAFATFGIGTSLAIKAAYYLAGEIGRNVQGPEDVPDALDRYEEVFRKVYGKYEDLPFGFPQMAFPRTKWGMAVRDALIWGVAKTKVYKLLPDEDKKGVEELGEYDWKEEGEVRV